MSHETIPHNPQEFHDQVIASQGYDVLDFHGAELDFDILQALQLLAEQQGVPPQLFTRAMGIPTLTIRDVIVFSPRELEEMVSGFEDLGGKLLGA